MHHGPETLIDDVFFDIDTSGIRQALLASVTMDLLSEHSAPVSDEVEQTAAHMAAQHADIWNQDF